MRRAAARNNIMAGLFLIGALLLGVVISFILGDVGSSIFQGKSVYVIRFPLEVGATGLKTGSEVTLGGQRIGRVEKVSLAFSQGESASVDGIDVKIAVDSRVRFRKTAKADLLVPFIGSISTINFAGVGKGADLVDDGDRIEGQLAPGLLAQAGVDKETIDNIKATIRQVKEITEEVRPNIKPTFDEIQQFAQSLNTRMDAWDERLTSILANVDDASDDLEPTLQSAQQGIEEVRDLLDEAKRMVEANRGKIDRSLTNVESITDRVRFESVDQIASLLDQGKAAMSQFTDLGEEANLLLVRESPKVSKTLDNVRELSGEANAMVSELRAQPWRVLKQPSREELSREPIYNAARSYARAVGDLRAASEALESIIAQVSADGASAGLVEPEALLGMRAWVEEAFGNYQHAEQELLDELVKRSQ
ncbi:MAG: hypothetical protein R3B57_12875 [Phycisphaerales bacterium]